MEKNSEQTSDLPLEAALTYSEMETFMAGPIDENLDFFAQFEQEIFPSKSVEKSYEMHSSGMSESKIIEERSMKNLTIRGHLAKVVCLGMRMSFFF